MMAHSTRFVYGTTDSEVSYARAESPVVAQVEKAFAAQPPETVIYMMKT